MKVSWLLKQAKLDQHYDNLYLIIGIIIYCIQ
jgi:hypothetical protein